MTHARDQAKARRFFKVMIVLAVAFVPPSANRAQEPANNLFGKKWSLSEMDQRPFSSDEPYFEFDREQNRVSGSGGCNSFAGAFEVNGSKLKFSHVVSTMRACLDAEKQKTETRFLRLLETVTRFEVQGQRLRLFANDRLVLILTERIASSQTGPSTRAADLKGTSWQLVKFQSGDGTITTPDERKKYTIEFGENGRVVVRFDCNRGSGTWNSSGASQLRFRPLALTKMMCPQPSLHDRLARDWTSIRSYLIKDGHLFLSLVADGGIYEFEPLSEAQARVTGTISYRQRIALAPDAVIEVSLLDVSRADTPSTPISKIEIKHAGRQVPISFELPYDSQRIDPRHRYLIQVRIFSGTSVWFTNTRAYPVITLGNPDSVNVIVNPVSRNRPGSSPEAQRKINQLAATIHEKTVISKIGAVKTVPQNVPQLFANQAQHARYAAHARTLFLSDFVSVENKGSETQIPKLDVAGSIPVARSKFLSNSLTQFSKVREKLGLFRKRSRKFFLRNCQDFKNVGEGAT